MYVFICLELIEASCTYYCNLLHVEDVVFFQESHAFSSLAKQKFRVDGSNLIGVCNKNPQLIPMS